MKLKRAGDGIEAVHQHRFVVRNPYQPEADRCECGMFRYEIMGPINRAKARARHYNRQWSEYPR